MCNLPKISTEKLTLKYSTLQQFILLAFVIIFKGSFKVDILYEKKAHKDIMPALQIFKKKWEEKKILKKSKGFVQYEV